MADDLKKPWIFLDAILIIGQLHKLPKNPEKWLPRFNPDDRIPAEDHIKSYTQAIRLRNVIHEDVVCRLFPYSFEGQASTWYFYLEVASINSWKQFEALFPEVWR